MDTPTKKRDKIVVDKVMKDKLVKALSGIGSVLGGELNNEGYQMAYQVLGKFVAVVEDKKEFDEWLKGKCNANVKQRKDCYDCLLDWCLNYRRSADTS